MDILILLAGAVIGAGIFYLGSKSKAEPKKEEQPPEIPKRMITQVENLLRYDGTDRGQQDIDD